MKNKYYHFLVPVFFFLLAPGCKKQDSDHGNYKYGVTSWQGTNVYSERYEGAIQKSRKLITEINRRSGLPGAQIAIAIDGDICWSENFGFSNLEEGTPVQSPTIFRIASVSKLFTATAVGKLIENGKLNLDTPIITYLPELPKSYSNITLRHLVSHQSGIRHYYGADKSEKTEHYNNVNDALGLFINAPLLFPPGENCEYSSYGWLLISAIIQRVSGRPFLEYMQNEIWHPIGLKNTFGKIPDERLKDVTKFYLKNSPQGSWEEAPYQDLSFNWGGAGISSNANDLVVFGNTLLNNKFLKKETLDLMFTPQLTNKNDTTGFGIGFTIYYTNDNEKIVGHGGFMPTAKSHLLLFPESNITIAYTSNTAMTNFSDETLVAIVHNFINQKKDERHFILNRTLYQYWTGLWQIEMEADDRHYYPAYLYFNEVSNELKGTILCKNSEPVQFEITKLKQDSIQFLAPLTSHTATVELRLTDGVLMGKSYLKKPLPYSFKKQLTQEEGISRMLAAKNIRNGKRLN